MAKLNQIGKADVQRFVLHSALLSLIDPVRGEPTRNLLDENRDGDIFGGQQLKQKFLDSFALICSTSSSGAETASAVCLEQHVQSEAILRVARNRGFTSKDLSGLERVLRVLRVVARKEKSSAQAEAEILYLVVELDRGRILSIAEKIEKHGKKHGIWSFLRETHSKFLAGQIRSEILAKPGLGPWLHSCPFTTAASPRAWNPTDLAVLISWASQARWLYSEQLQDLLGHDAAQKSPWLDSLYKIARYRSTIKSMVKLAVMQPEVFADIQIREVEVEAPSWRSLSLSGHKAALSAAIQDLVGKEAGMTMQLLEKHLGTQDVEATLRRVCGLHLTLHAEMQLVVFYEGNPELAPLLRFIGTSKKACFLCHEYLLQHPLRLQVSACHQKIYPSWMPPPYFPVPRQFKNPPFLKLSKRIEQLTKLELKTALTAPRRPRNQDSTAGPSLTTTATVQTGPVSATVQFALENDSLLENSM
ncbi:hypothetical protein BR93DRAFT_885843 [Coniochaeta sp. PMI_546]|nr:hypothetical protein BR93DRAFT_885843 [Coniochaeta sp. PMI_546]